ncbi:Adenine-specific methyltransferase [Hyphomicrobium sulfonivorans]|uniref:Methyltransferase n=1 Tax=Hyphomicrobium sulfonivorans TaxID=121290 RepID=A0A109BL35_HYPSL|nr:site-specific DNA-methyltransferase [Hyphomicrobium sulfonivorans]KWT70734.1 Adenine-specific methyltransferase [Hyphomicrobium sulfonivorans]
MIVHGDCLHELPLLEAGSIDMVLADPPYGMTRNRWDCRIDLQRLWPLLRRACKRSAAILITAAPPYDKVLAASNLADYRYDWVWEKTNATGHLNAKRMPLKAHENVCVFYSMQPTFNPQKSRGHRPVNTFYSRHSGSNYGAADAARSGGGSTDRYPRTVQQFKSDKQSDHRHATQKPVDLLRYLIRTYSDPGDTVLDFCMGSGSTAIACALEGRSFVGIEIDEATVSDAAKRLAAVITEDAEAQK